MTWNKAGLLKIINTDREDTVPDLKELTISAGARRDSPQLRSARD